MNSIVAHRMVNSTCYILQLKVKILCCCKQHSLTYLILDLKEQ